MKKILLFFSCFILLHPSIVKAQEPIYAGQFSLGVRNTGSIFGDAGSFGLGFGGQFRVRLGKHINTEWFADYMSTNIQNLGYRKDGHIGWSVMFYPGKNPLQSNKFTPYFLAGHCFDYTKLTSLDPTEVPADKWSSAVQMGIGTHYLISENFDVSFSTQYMIHLGGHLESQIGNHGQGPHMHIKQESGLDLEGHLIGTLSFNYKIAQLWQPK
jgi:hypothetical protein